MKRYYNSTTKEWYNEGQSLTKRVENGVFTGIPSEEQLTQWGFREWVEPTPTPQQLLERAKSSKISDIQAYDSSEEVNSFIINFNDTSINAWITPDKRADYKNSLDSAELLGMEEVHPVFNGIEITLPVDVAKMDLAKIQIYANQCYNVTEQHKAAVNSLTTIKEVEDYDYKAGYPSKLTFDI